MVADCELSVRLISTNVSDFELSVLLVSVKKSKPELSVLSSETINAPHIFPLPFNEFNPKLSVRPVSTYKSEFAWSVVTNALDFEFSVWPVQRMSLTVNCLPLFSSLKNLQKSKLTPPIKCKSSKTRNQITNSTFYRHFTKKNSFQGHLRLSMQIFCWISVCIFVFSVMQWLLTCALCSWLLIG